MNVQALKNYIPLIVVATLLLLAVFLPGSKSEKSKSAADGAQDDLDDSDKPEIDPLYGGRFAIQIEGEKYYKDSEGNGYYIKLAYPGYFTFKQVYVNPYRPDTEEAEQWEKEMNGAEDYPSDIFPGWTIKSTESTESNGGGKLQQ